MKNPVVTYNLYNSDNKLLAEIVTTLPGELMNQYLYENGNVWNEVKFIDFVNSFKEVKFKYKIYHV